jgi:hypothetical protein
MRKPEIEGETLMGSDTKLRMHFLANVRLSTLIARRLARSLAT